MLSDETETLAQKVHHVGEQDNAPSREWAMKAEVVKIHDKIHETSSQV